VRITLAIGTAGGVTEAEARVLFQVERDVVQRAALRAQQRPSEAIRGYQRQSEVHQRYSEALRGTQRHSEVIRGNQR
jgi:hypothetical protein